jgi:N-acetylglucosamine-6-phosphate deacetylase
VIKNKGENTLVVSDATCFAGMPPGEYQNHIGGTVILDQEKKISLKSTPGILAGAAKSLLENVENLINQNLATLGESWKMASTNVAKMLRKRDETFCNKNDDLVIFQLNGKEIQVEKVIKNNKIVFEK